MAGLPIKNLKQVFKLVYNRHRQSPVEYTLSEEASNMYDQALKISVLDYNSQYPLEGR